MQPKNLISTRLALHRLATYVIAPTRFAATGKFGLRATPEGFGTQTFGDNERRIRVRGHLLIDESARGERSAPITSLAAAADFLGASIDSETAAEHDSTPLGDVDADLQIDEEASLALGSWFNMAFDALHSVAADVSSIDASEPQLWPGHFDAAIEIGDEDHRGSYGASPGDGGMDEPYLYLSIWWPDKVGIDPSDPTWNATTFTGALLPQSDFPVDVDVVDAAAQFWRGARDRLR